MITLNLEDKTFVIYIAFVIKLVHPSQKVLIVGLEVEKITIPKKYLDFVDVFFSDFAAKLLKHFGINNYAIYLQEDKQPSYGLIYSLEPIKLKTLKIYIETNLNSNFIRFLKSQTSASILFVYKKNKSL